MSTELQFALEHRMNALLKHLNLDYAVLLQPDPFSDKFAMTFPDRKLIEVYAVQPENAWRSFLHEVVEIVLKPLIEFHNRRETHLAALLEIGKESGFFEAQSLRGYAVKESAIRQLEELLLVLSEEVPSQ